MTAIYVTLAVIGCVIYVWIVIALDKKQLRKKFQQEEENPIMRICHCKECGYTGWISQVLHGERDGPFVEDLFHCPECGDYIWYSSGDILFVKREDADAEIAKLKAKYSQEKSQQTMQESRYKCPHCGGGVDQVVNEAVYKQVGKALKKPKQPTEITTTIKLNNNNQ